LVGFLLNQFGLLEPFLVLAVLSLISIVVVLGLIPPDGAYKAAQWTVFSKINRVLRSGPALAGLGVMILISLANQLVNVVFGVWLNASFGMQIAALGGASAVIGLAELLGESGVSALADRLNKQRAVLIGVGGNILASILLPLLGGAAWGAYLGLFLFYLTFEFSIVSLIPLMTGVLPPARGTVMALMVASANLGRGLGSLAAAPLYLGGFWVNAISAALVNLLAIACLRFVLVQEES
ncbi:MAG: MFS transporter, partial [Anaerolineales bacterium]